MSGGGAAAAPRGSAESGAPIEVPRAGGAPGVSVIIPARDAAATIGRTLDALAAQTQGEFEVIIVDDGSRDATAEIVERHPLAVRLIRRDRGGGAGAARNLAVEASSAPVLAFTDSDCFPTATWLAGGLRAISNFDLVQGAVAPEPDVPRTPFDRSLSAERDRSFYQTANLFVRRELFTEVGGFQDWALPPQPGSGAAGGATRRPVGEDTLFGWMALRRGARSAFAPDALVHHVVLPGTVRTAARDRWNWTRKMPGLARRVPELRDGTFYHRWFFADWTALTDLAALGTLVSVMTRRRTPLIACLPYLRRVWREASLYRDGRDTRLGGLRRAARYVLGAPVVDAVTLAGLVVGSFRWRSLVL